MQLRKDNLTWQVVGDDVVVLDLQGSVYLQVKDGSGRVLWESLAEGASQEQLASTLVERYGIDATRAEADVATFLADLRGRDLLTD